MIAVQAGATTNLLTVLGAFSSFTILLKAFDWMRLFDESSFYILLLKETIGDIKYFMILFMLSLFMFGVPLALLSIS